MKLLEYIKGDRKGKEIHRLEKEAMQDPLLADALDGFDAVEGDHSERIRQLQERIDNRSQARINWLRIGSIAAALLLVAGTAIYFLRQTSINPAEPALLSYQELTEDNAIPQQEEIAISSPESEDYLFAENAIADLEMERREISKESNIAQKSIALPPPVYEQNDAEEELVDLDVELIVQAEAKEISIDPDTSQSPLIAMNPDQQELSEVMITGMQSSHIRTLPSPAISQEAYQRYLKENLKQPEDDCLDKKGKVILTFAIDTKGRPYDIQVKQSLCPSSDKEAIRLLKEGPDWKISPDIAELEIKF